MDHSEDKGLGSMDRSNGEYPESDLDGAKSCEGCGATQTPLWRGGPSGPKSLCNACGIRYRKRGRGDPGLKGGGKEKRMGVSFKWSGWGGRRRDVLMRLRRWAAIQKQGVLREEEEAAVLLMALSSGLLCSSAQKI